MSSSSSSSVMMDMTTMNIVELIDDIGNDIVHARKAFDRYSNNDNDDTISLWGLYCALETALKIDLFNAIQSMQKNNNSGSSSSSKQTLLYSYFLNNGYVSSTYGNDVIDATPSSSSSSSSSTRRIPSSSSSTRRTPSSSSSSSRSDIYSIQFNYIHYLYFYLKLKNINDDDNSITVTGTTTTTTVNVTNDTTSNNINRNIRQEEEKKENNDNNNDKRPTSSMFKEDYLDPIRRARLRYFNNTSSVTILSDIRSNDNIAHVDATSETTKGIKALMKDTTSSMSIKRHELVIVPASHMDPLDWFRSIDYYETLECLIISLDTRQRLLTKERNLSYDMIHKIFRNMDLNNIYGNDSSSTNDHTNDTINTNDSTDRKDSSTALIYLTDLNMFLLKVTLWDVKPDNWFHEQLLSYRSSNNITTSDTISWEETIDFFVKWISLIVKRELKALRNLIAKEVWKNVKRVSLTNCVTELCKKSRVIVRKYRRPLDC